MGFYTTLEFYEKVENDEVGSQIKDLVQNLRIYIISIDYQAGEIVAKFKCFCGEVMWNGRVPNEIQLHFIEIEIWNEALSRNLEIFDLDEHDIWRCPECLRLYWFERIQVKAVYQIEQQSLSLNGKTYCSCGNQDNYQEFIVYTDIEIDTFTLDSETVSDMPMPNRDVVVCNSCLRLHIFDKETNQVQHYIQIIDPFKSDE